MKMTKTTLVLAFLLCTGWQAMAQNDKSNEAFKKSYLYEKAGDYEKSIAAIKEVYEDLSYEANLRLGWLYYVSAKYTEATLYYNKAIALRPNCVEAKLGLIYPAAASNNWDVVVQQYNKILAIDPQNTNANYYLGMYYYNKKDYKTAFPYFEKVANLYPFDYSSTLMVAWTTLRMNKKPEAKDLFNKVLMISPEDKSAMEGLAMIK